MPTIEELQKIFSVNFDDLEKNRLARLKKLQNFNIYTAAFVIMVFITVIVAIFFNAHFLVLLTIVIVAIALAAKYFSFFHNKINTDFDTYYKDTFLSKVINKLDGNFHYDKALTDTVPLLQKALKLKDLPPAKTEDLIESTTADGWSFSFSEIHKKKREAHAFASMTYQIKLPHNFQSNFYFTPHANKANPSKEEKEFLVLQNSRGEKFEIETNQIAFAKQLLTPSFLDTFIRIKKTFQTRNPIEFSLVDDSFYIVIPTIRKYLNVNTGSPVRPIKLMERLASEMNIVSSPIKLIAPLLANNIAELIEIDKVSS